MAVGTEDLRETMRCWATGVTIVTSQHEGIQHGMTVSSFTSISLDPPLVLVSLERGTRTRNLVMRSGFFGITVLSAQQQDLSERFAGRIPEIEDRFNGLETYTLSSGVPLISGGLASLDCRMVAFYEIATHTVFVGEVVDIYVDPQSTEWDHPLIYYNRSYHRL